MLSIKIGGPTDIRPNEWHDWQVGSNYPDIAEGPRQVTFVATGEELQIILNAIETWSANNAKPSREQASLAEKSAQGLKGYEKANWSVNGLPYDPRIAG